MTSEPRPGCPSPVRFIQVAVPILMILGGSYWGYLSFASFPWIVPPDHDIALVRLHTSAALDELWMVEVSILLILVSLIVRRFPRFGLGTGLLTLVGLIYFQISHRVYGFLAAEAYRSWVTIAYIVVDVLLMAVAVGILRSRPPSRDSGSRSETGNPVSPLGPSSSR